MSHLTHVQNVFVRRDLLLKALEALGVPVQEPGEVRYWGGQVSRADIVARLDRIGVDVGFVLRNLTRESAHLTLDESEYSDGGAPTQAYTPVYDQYYESRISEILGKNLCLVHQGYYKAMLEEEAFMNGGTVSVEETPTEILVTLEI